MQVGIVLSYWGRGEGGRVGICSVGRSVCSSVSSSFLILYPDCAFELLSGDNFVPISRPKILVV